MLKNISRIEIVVNEKVYHFVCDQDSILDDAENAAFQFLSYIRNIKERAKAAQDQAKAEKELEDKAKLEANSAESKEVIEDPQSEQV